MSAFAEGGTVKRKTRPRSTKAAVVYAHTIADELLALWGETVRDVYSGHDGVHQPYDVRDALMLVHEAFRDLRHEVE